MQQTEAYSWRVRHCVSAVNAVKMCHQRKGDAEDNEQGSVHYVISHGEVGLN